MRKGFFLGITMITACFLLTGCHLKHEWQEATCTEPKTCSVGGETEGEPLGHAWVEATCTEAKTCNVCGETDGEALGHVWTEASCTKAKTCSTCSGTEGEALGHTWIEATCIVPKTCSTCGENEGEVAEHRWIDATCLTPKNCDTCGITEGDVIDHNWVEATCQAPTTCSMCGLTDGNALEHQMNEAGLCGLCNQQIAIPLTLENIYDYLSWDYIDLTQLTKKPDHNDSVWIVDLEFSIKNPGGGPGTFEQFRKMKDLILIFETTISYKDGTTSEAGNWINQKSIEAAIGELGAGEIASALQFEREIGVQPKGIEQLYASNLGTVYNFNYDLDVVLSGVSGYVMVDSGAEQQDGSRIFSMNNISDISATSSLTENNMTHSPERLIDGDLSTAWVEGVDGEGMGETIRITFDRSYQLKGMKIHAGYQKNSEVYKNNSRPSCIVVMYSDGTSQTHALWDVNEAQELVLYDDIPTEYLEIMIESTYPGGKYEDTAITEIEIY